MNHKPILAPNVTPTEQDLLAGFPWIGSVKLDGIRCLAFPDGCLYSRTGKSIQNVKIWELLKDVRRFCAKHNVVLDGELWTPKVSFQQIMSLVMTRSKDLGNSQLRYHIFDMIDWEDWQNETEPNFNIRLTKLNVTLPILSESAIVHDQTKCHQMPMVQEWFNEVLQSGGEGLILRNPRGKYKHGRCTQRESNMFKLKDVQTEDAQVVDFTPLERMAEDVERTFDAFGHAESVNKKDDRVTQASLGALVVKLKDGTQFNVGSGFNFRGGEKDRDRIWACREQLKGQWIEFKHQPQGIKEKPRLPVFVRWRQDKEYGLSGAIERAEERVKKVTDLMKGN